MIKHTPGQDARSEALAKLDKEIRKTQRDLAAAKRKEQRTGADPALTKEIQRLQGELVKKRLERKGIEAQRITPEDYAGEMGL